MYKKCVLCPRKCGVNRENEYGYCKASDKLMLARASLHHWEEPSISGTSGSGTVFFSGCSLKCVYCQNKPIASMEIKKEVTFERLVEIYFELYKKGANNINLVSPGHFIPHIIKSIETSRKKGLDIPFVYNTSGYENKQSIKMLDGLIDIYLTDFKYMSPKLAKKYSNAQNYPDVCMDALDEMYRQMGKNTFYTDKNNELLMKSGIIVRHLILPGCTGDSMRILKYLYNMYKDNIFISIMNQYTPVKDYISKEQYPELLRRVTAEEYKQVTDYAVELGIKNAYVQSAEAAQESFIPCFNYEGL